MSKFTEPKGFDFTGAELVEDAGDSKKALEGVSPLNLPESVLNGTEELVAALGEEECSETEISLSYTTRKTTE